MVTAWLIAMLALPQAAAAAKYYGFWFGGVKVTSDNCSNITSKNITPNADFYPQAWYEPEENTLYVRNIKVERTGGYNHALENESNDGLTVVFMGKNEFRAKNSSTIFLKKNTTLKSYNGNTEENTLRVWCYEYEGIHVQNKATLTIEGLGIDVFSDKHYPLSAKREEGLYIKNSAVTVYGGDRFYDFKDITFENITFDAFHSSSTLIYISDTDPSHYYTLTLKGENKANLDWASFIKTKTNFTIKGDGSFMDYGGASQGILVDNNRGMTFRLEGGCALTFSKPIPFRSTTGNETLEIDNSSLRNVLFYSFNNINISGSRIVQPAGGTLTSGKIMVDGEEYTNSVTIVKSEWEKPSIVEASVKVEDVTHTTATVTWKQATDNVTPKELMRYLVFLDDSRTGNRKHVGELMGKDTLKLKDLTPDTRYTVTVKAQDECGNFAFYNEKTFTTPTDKEAYAAVSGSTLTFYYDNQRAKRSGHPITNSTSSDPAWLSRNIKKVVFDDSFKNYSPTSTYHWFAGMSALERVEKTENLRSAKVLNMVGMFEGCTSLKELDLMKLVVSSLSDISEMFKNAENLTTIYSEQDWRPRKADNMFKGCEKLVGVVAYDANKTSSRMATPYEGYFTPKRPAEAYVVRSENKGVLTFYNDAFKGCRKGTTYGINDTYRKYDYDYPAWVNTDGDTFARSAVIDASMKDFRPKSMEMWFYNFRYIDEIKGLENLNTEEVTTMRWMFGRSQNLMELDLTGFKTRLLQNTEGMFKGCECLGYIYCNEAWTATRSTDMFQDCTELIGAVKYDPNKTDIKMANPTTGYFTRKGSTGINRPTTVDEPTVKVIYGTDGSRRSRMEPGINILKMSDGTTRKVVK